MKKINLGQKDIIHFIGIGGIGMSGLAQIMKNMGLAPFGLVPCSGAFRQLAWASHSRMSSGQLCSPGMLWSSWRLQ